MISDTSPEIERIVLELRRRQSPGERLSNAFELTELVRSFELGVLRARHPEAGPEELIYLLGVKRYGPDLARRICGLRAASA